MTNEELEEQMDIQEKMSGMHRGMYQRILGIQELPLPLLKRYFSIKKLLDKVDVHITPIALVRIALDVGFNPETMRFDGSISANIPLAESVEMLQIEPDEPEPEEIPVEEPIEEEVTITDEDSVNTATAGGEENSTGTTVDEETPVTETEEPTADGLAIGAEVAIFFNGDILKGTINGSRVEDGERFYSVDTEEDGVIEVSEDEVDDS